MRLNKTSRWRKQRRHTWPARGYSGSSPPSLLWPQATCLGRAAKKCQLERVLHPSPAYAHIQVPWQVIAVYVGNSASLQIDFSTPGRWYCQELPPKKYGQRQHPASGTLSKTHRSVAFLQYGKATQKKTQPDWLASYSAPPHWNQAFQLAPRVSWKDELTPFQSCTETWWNHRQGSHWP